MVPARTLNNGRKIRRRVDSVPVAARRALDSVLSYLFLKDGPSNLRNPVFQIAKPYLEHFEIVLARYLKSRTNGSGRKFYGNASHRAKLPAREQPNEEGGSGPSKTQPSDPGRIGARL